MSNEPHTFLVITLVPSFKNMPPLKWTISKDRFHLLNSPTSLQPKNKDTQYHHMPEHQICLLRSLHFFVPYIVKLDKVLIELTGQICWIPISSPNIFIKLPWGSFRIKAHSLLPMFATTLAKQPSQTLNDLGQLRAIYQGLVKYIFTNIRGTKYLPRLIYQACYTRCPTTRALYIIQTKFNLHQVQTTNTAVNTPITMSHKDFLELTLIPIMRTSVGHFKFSPTPNL